MTSQPSQSPLSRLLAYFELLRLPNLFTAVADVAMGFLVTHHSFQPSFHFLLLVLASSLLYLAGMVLNDVYDVEVDAQDRPHRPIPSGRVSLFAARTLGWGMLASGTLVAWLVSYQGKDWRPGLVGLMLAACIVLYDWLLKKTPLAPLVMGGCRGLNVLLGMSLASDVVTGLPRTWLAAEGILALGIGIYITGVTWFARTEARISSRGHLLGGTLLLIGGIGLIASFPRWLANGDGLAITERGWYLLWIVLALVIARRCARAVVRPVPMYVQAAVRHCILSLIVLDASICLGVVGVYWGCAVLLLLAPTLLLGLWLETT